MPIDNNTKIKKLTTTQTLGSLVKSARDIMRKDKGLNGDLDRLPMLTWIMFLKFLDDLEIQREQENKLAEKKFKPTIEQPYAYTIVRKFSGSEQLNITAVNQLQSLAVCSVNRKPSCPHQSL